MSSRTNLLQSILESPRTVFTVQSLMMQTASSDSGRLTKSLYYYANEGKIRNPRRGIYTKQKYNVEEMACSLFRPSYISLEYVLQRAGVVFQWDDTVTCVSYLSRTVEVDGKQYQYRKIAPELWIGMEGIEQQDNVAIATPERAFLDTLRKRILLHALGIFQKHAGSLAAVQIADADMIGNLEARFLTHRLQL